MADVGYFEQWFTHSDKLALLDVLLQNGACDGGLDDGVGNLVVELALLHIDARLLRVDALDLRIDALSLFGQTGIVAAYLVLCGAELLLEHTDLIVDLVNLLLWHGPVAQQLGVALPLASGIGNLLSDAGHLFLQVEPLAGGRVARGTQLSLVGTQLAAGGLELLLLQHELRVVNLSHLGAGCQHLTLVHVKRCQLARCLGRHSDLGGLECAGGIKLLLLVAACGEHCHHGCI